MRKITAVDLFCGAGGTSTGLHRAAQVLGAQLKLTAINHWPVAIETHSANHPEAEHLCERVDLVDPHQVVRGRLDLLVASPECTHHSIARGGKPLSDQSRASAWEVVRWATELRPSWILMENVREFRSWGPLGRAGRPLKTKRGETFRAFLQALHSLNYTVEHRILNAADYGAATSRQRLFVLARLGRHRSLPWPEATHAPLEQLSLFERQPWRAAREIIDWRLVGESIFRRRRPLAQATLRRIEAGLRRFGGKAAEPFLLMLTHGGRLHSLDRPLPTVTGANRGELGLVRPFLLPHRLHGAGHVDSIDDPLRSFTASNGGGQLVEPFLVPFYGERDGQAPRHHSLDEPLPTVTCENRHGLVEPFLVNYYGQGRPCSVREPLGTITTRDRYALVEPQGLRPDIHFRMLQPHELAQAMGFGADYRFAGTKTDQVRQIGNAVEVNKAEALCRAMLQN